MRDRLIELLRNAPKTDTVYGDVKLPHPVQTLRTIVDHLLAAGVIVPPCKVWDTVFYLTSVDTEKELNLADVLCGFVQSVAFDGRNIWIAAKYTNGLYYHHNAQDIGRDVFLTREEAERAIAERRTNDGT
jgi:hypothetical protein